MANTPQAIQLQISVKPAQLLVGTAAVIGLLFAMVTISTSSIVRAQNEATVNQNTQQPQAVYACNDAAKGSSSVDGFNDSEESSSDYNHAQGHAHGAAAIGSQHNHSVVKQTDSNDVTTINRYNYRNSFNKNNNNGNALGSFNGNVLGSFNNNKLNSGNTDINVRNSFNDESVTIKDNKVDNSVNTTNLDASVDNSVTIKDNKVDASVNTQNNEALVINN